MTPPPADYPWLQYVPYVLIAAIVVAIWGPKTLIRQRSKGVRSGRGSEDG